MSTRRNSGVVFVVVVAFLSRRQSEQQSGGSFERRLISLIFAGRNRIIMIRRELPLTVVASQVEPVAEAKRGFSFMLALAAAGSVYEMDVSVHRIGVLIFSFLESFVWAVIRQQVAGWK